MNFPEGISSECDADVLLASPLAARRPPGISEASPSMLCLSLTGTPTPLSPEDNSGPKDVLSGESSREGEACVHDRCSNVSMVDGRGRYNRCGHKTRVSHADQAREALEAVQASMLAGACDKGCSRGCEGRFTRNEILLAIEHSYGVIKWVSNETLAVEKKKKSLAYGVGTVDENGQQGRWSTTVKSKETHERWTALFDTFTVFRTAADVPTTSFSVGGKETCSGFARKAYGIPEVTWNVGMAAAKKRPSGARIARELQGCSHTSGDDDVRGVETSTGEV
jgi:hypothetical protein